jgi:hypothetical protein
MEEGKNVGRMGKGKNEKKKEEKMKRRYHLSWQL